MFVNRKIIGEVDGVEWEVSNDEHEALSNYLNQSNNAKEAFTKLINFKYLEDI